MTTYEYTIPDEFSEEERKVLREDIEATIQNRIESWKNIRKHF